MSAPRPQPSEPQPTLVLTKIVEVLHHIKEHTAAMALSLERIEEMAAKEREYLEISRMGSTEYMARYFKRDKPSPSVDVPFDPMVDHQWPG